MESWRITLIFFFILILPAVIIFRLVNLQIIDHEMWQALAQGQQIFFATIQGNRGEVFLENDNDKVPFAINEPSTFCFISPYKIKDKEKTAEKLSSILNLNKEEILDKVNQMGKFAALEHNLTDKQVKRIKSLDLKGVYLEEEQVRNYPQKETGAQVIGFVGGNNMGQYGIESYYNEILQGKEGFIKGEKSSSGNLIFAEERTKDQEGEDLLLTIDYNIQFFAEQLLKKAHEDLNIRSGSITVMDPDTGGIYALANYPDFDPNKYSEEEMETFQNGVVQKLFEPGSVFKPITFAGALDERAITPQTTYVDEGKVEIGGHVIRNYNQREFGESTMTEVLEKSINTGAIYAEEQLGDKKFMEYLEKFEIFEKTGIDLPGEIASKNEELKKGYEVNYATAAFGQGIEMTPIQLLRAFSAIVNGGRLVKPHVVKKVLDDGKTVKEIKTSKSERIISPGTSAKLTKMLVSAIENGFGKRAKVPGYYIGGKTGTAQISWSALGKDKSGYSDQTWQSFVGFVPAFHPEFLILVKLDNPEARTAEYSAVPLFQELTKYIINQWEIPPDYEPD